MQKEFEDLVQTVISGFGVALGTVILLPFEGEGHIILYPGYYIDSVCITPEPGYFIA